MDYDKFKSQESVFKHFDIYRDVQKYNRIILVRKKGDASSKGIEIVWCYEANKGAIYTARLDSFRHKKACYIFWKILNSELCNKRSRFEKIDYSAIGEPFAFEIYKYVLKEWPELWSL